MFQAVEGKDCLHTMSVQCLNSHQALILATISKGGSNKSNNNDTNVNNTDDDASERLTIVTF